MRAFLIRICDIAVWPITLIELVILLLALTGSDKGKKPLHLFTALVAFGLFYDALIIALGWFLDDGARFFLSRLRFVFHGALIPLLFPIHLRVRAGLQQKVEDGRLDRYGRSDRTGRCRGLRHKA